MIRIQRLDPDCNAFAGFVCVVAAPVFPTITSGKTNAPTIMVAQKGADSVLR